MACINVKSTSDAIRAIGDSLRFDSSNWEDVLTGLNSDQANQLRDRVSNFLSKFSEKFDTVQDAIDNDKRGFVRTWKLFEASLLNDFRDISENKYAEIDKTNVDIALSFGRNDVAGINRVTRRFTKNLVESTIIKVKTNDDGTIKSIESRLRGTKDNKNEQVNRNLHQFKLDLLDDINRFTAIEVDRDFNIKDDVFTKMIVDALTAFEIKQAREPDLSDETYKKAHDAYVLLKFFDKFVLDSKIVEVKDGYKNSAKYSTNMYEYVGPESNPPSHWGKDEIADADNTSSPLTKLIFDYMPEIDSNGVAKNIAVENNGFKHVMNRFKKWSRAKGYTKALANLETSELLLQLKEFLSEHNTTGGNILYTTNYPDKIRGIIKVLENLDEDTIQKIWKQINTEEDMRYTMYSKDGNKIQLQTAEQRVVSSHELKILDRIKNAVFEYGVMDPERFTELCNKYGITYDGTYVYFGSKDGKTGFVRLRLNKGTDVSLEYFRGNSWIGTSAEYTLKNPDGTIDTVLPEVNVQALNNWFIPLIETVLGEIPAGWEQFTQNKNLVDLFAPALGNTFLALFGHSGYEFDRIGEDKVKVLNTNTTHFKNRLRDLASLFASCNGVDTVITMKNLNGDSIPAFSLTSWIRNTHRTVEKLRNESIANGWLNVFGDNFVYKNISKVGEPLVRRDMQIGDNNTQSSRYSENEVLYLGMTCDFFAMLYDGKSNQIYFQNTTNSDKSTHWIIPYDKDILIDKANGDTIELQEALKNIISGNKSKEAINAIRYTLYKSRRAQYTALATNLINDFNLAMDWDLNSESDLLNSIIAIRNYVNTHPNIVQNFKEKKVTFINELHASRNGFNESLFHELKTYLQPKEILFDKHIDTQLQYFVSDLVDDGFEMNIYDDDNVIDILTKFSDEGKGWLDTKTGNVLLYREQNGKRVYNPLLESYFYGDVLLSSEFNKLSNGFFWMHNGKYTPKEENGDYETVNGEKQLSEAYYIHDMSARLAASYKRTVINGASIEAYAPQKYGIADHFTYAEVKDIKGTVWNMMGIQDDGLDSMDGSALVHPIFATLCGWSSTSGKVTYDNKTICGDIGSKFGVPDLFKWAEFGVTNHRRQMGFLSNASPEHIFQVMSDISLNTNIKLEDYYGFKRIGRNITKPSQIRAFHDGERPTILYKRNPFTGKTYVIHDLSTKNSICTYKLSEVDNNGFIIGPSEEQSRMIETLYDIDQIFGGAWCMKLGDKGLEFYDGNIRTTAEIVCDYGLKDKFLSYIVNSSAHKNGNRNINSNDILYRNKATRNEDGRFDIMTSTSSTYNLGKQMNPDHELEFAEVSEMSQMISSLIQGGHFTPLVDRIYQEIGEVAAQAMRTTQNAVNRGDANEIYRILGESLMEAFETGNRNTTGLAQSFLIKAKKALNDANIKYEIPFSAATINGAFISDIISSINKKGIRRKYSGIASVLVPSNDMIQTFTFNGRQIMFTEFAKEVLKTYPRVPLDVETIDESIENDQLHVYRLMNDIEYAFENGVIQEYASDALPEIEDTVVVQNTDGTYTTIKLDSFDNLDTVRNRLREQRLFSWTVKPKNLKQADITFTVNGRTHSMYDFDSVRALHYLRDNNLTSDKIEVIKVALAKRGIIWDGKSSLNKKQAWNELLKLQKKDIANIDKGYVEPQIAFGNVTSANIYDVNYKAAEMIMGRLHAKELGLKEGDSISDILDQGENFFYERLKDRTAISKAADVYDYAVVTNTGHTIYVNIKSKHKEVGRYSTENKSFTHDDTGIWYNHEEKIADNLGNGVRISTIQNFSGESCPLLIVESEEQAQDFLEGDSIDFIYYNINENSFEEVVKSAFSRRDLQSGITIQRGNRRNPEIVLNQQLLDNFRNLSQEEKSNLVLRLKDYLDNRNDIRARNLAHKKRLAFNEQLEYVGARIPTQSMQSFQRLRLVGFSESLKNEVYVPKIQTFLQGSDYDVDKLYIMSYFLASNGTMPVFSKLDSEPELKSLKPLLGLKMPNGKFYSKVDYNPKSLEIGSYQLTDNLVIDKYDIDGNNFEYVIYSNENPNNHIVIQNGIDNNYVVTESTLENPTKALKAFIELIEPNSFITLNIPLNIKGLIRSKYVNQVTDNILMKNSSFKHENFIMVTDEQLENAVNFKNFSVFNDIMESPTTKIMFEGNNPLSEEKFLRLLNKHTQGKPNFELNVKSSLEDNVTEEDIIAIENNDKRIMRRLDKDGIYMINASFLADNPERITKVLENLRNYRSDSVKIPNKERALQNSVLENILNLLSKSTIQNYGHNPISMDNIKSIVKSDPKEMRLNMDNPLTKFRMQIQNMVGKEVIGISAVSMKVFFAASTYFNKEIENVVKAYNNGNDNEACRNFFNILLLDYSGTTPELNTIANLNLQPLENLDLDLNLGVLSKGEVARLRPILSRYRDANGRITIKSILEGNKRVRGLITKSQMNDAAASISELLSAATDRKYCGR